jgi:hypothetical protein
MQRRISPKLSNEIPGNKLLYAGIETSDCCRKFGGFVECSKFQRLTGPVASRKRLDRDIECSRISKILGEHQCALERRHECGRYPKGVWLCGPLGSTHMLF